MKNDDVIKLGDMVDLAGHKNRMYRTKIEDMTPNGLFLVGVPRFSGAPMPIHVNEDIYLVYYRPNGRFIVRMNVVGFEKRGDIRYVWLYQKTEPYKDQRREAFRVPVRRAVSVCEHPREDGAAPPETGVAGGIGWTGETAETAGAGGPAETAKTGGPAETDETAGTAETGNREVLEEVSSSDLSVTGISFLTKREYTVGDKQLLMIYIHENRDENPPVTVSAIVARSTPMRESGRNLVGMKFSGLNKSQHEYISKFVLEEQRRQLKQKRLVEGV